MASIGCPNCRSPLKKTNIVEHLAGQLCSSCKGISITLGNYLHYLAKSPVVNDAVKFADDDVVMDEDTKAAMVCTCGQVMNKYRVSADSDRKLDYCTSCQTIWMDVGEWEYLRSNNMHKSINKVFTDVWQRRIRHENTRNVLGKNYQERLGEQDYQRIKEIRDWIEGHPEKATMLSYLNAYDPYSTEQ